MTAHMLLGKRIRHRTSGAFGWVAITYPGSVVFVQWAGQPGASNDAGAYVHPSVLELAPDVCVDGAS